jgi:hypothetical protein
MKDEAKVRALFVVDGPYEQVLFKGLLTLVVKWIQIILGFNHHATIITHMLEKTGFHMFKVSRFFAASVIF